MYNFYIFLIIIVLIKPVNKFLLKNIFNTLEIIEEIVLSTFIIFITFLFIFKFIQKGSFNKLFNKLITNKNNIVPKILIYDLSVLILILTSAFIIYNEKIIYGETMKIALYIIAMAIITVVYNGGLNIQFSIGLILIIIGIYYVELGNSKLKYTI
tara:strand:- start:827 stop:1291 length:465 start_codon:yes stop_codon:yes gene_type:complete